MKDKVISCQKVTYMYKVIQGEIFSPPMSSPGDTKDPKINQDSTTCACKCKLRHIYKVVLPSISVITLNCDIKTGNIKVEGKISFTPLKTTVQ